MPVLRGRDSERSYTVYVLPNLAGSDRMVAGGCGGVAEYLDVDPTIVPVVSVLVMCLTAFIPGVVAYDILWYVIPREALK